MPVRPTRIDTGALLARTHPLPDGTRVRLRMLHSSDLPALRELFARGEVAGGDVALARLVRHDPRARLVICAAAHLGVTETVIGVVAADLREGSAIDVLVVDEDHRDGLRELLVGALQDRLEHHSRRVA